MSVIHLVRRLGVVVLYDKDGIIDRYVFYLLYSLSNVVQSVVVAINGTIKPEYIFALRSKGYTVYCRPNRGGDFGAYKDVLENFLGWEEVNRYDELVLSNDTYYGPFSSFSKIFAKMDERSELDFWTMTKTEGDFESQSGGIPRSAQGYFTVIRSRMLHTSNFRKFWQQKIFNDSNQHKDWVAIEHAWLDFFEKEFAWDAYVDSPVFSTSSMRGKYPVYLFANGRMIAISGCPVLKRRNFNYGYRTLQYTGHGDLGEALTYIEDHTDYDVEMIWENVLRVYNIVDIKEAVPLAYMCETGLELSGSENSLLGLIMIIALPHGKQITSYLQEYVGKLSADTVLLVKDSQDKEAAIKFCRANAKFRYKVVITDGQENLLFLLWHAELWEQYASLCFIDIYENEMAGQSIMVGETYRRGIWQSLAADDGCLKQMQDLLAHNKRLGMLVPQEAYHGDFFAQLGDTWDDYYTATRQLAEALEINCDISHARQTFGYTGSFFCQREALCKLCRRQELIAWWREADYELRLGALRRLLIYGVQTAGFYTATVQTVKQARQDISDLRFMLQEMVVQLRHDLDGGNFVAMMLAWKKRQLLDFARRFERIYIYGAGEYGQMVFEVLQENDLMPVAFVISDGQPKGIDDLPLKIIFLSDAVIDDQTGIIVAVIKHRQGELVNAARECGFHNVFAI